MDVRGTGVKALKSYKDLVIEMTALLPRMVYMSILAVRLFYFKVIGKNL